MFRIFFHAPDFPIYFSTCSVFFRHSPRFSHMFFLYVQHWFNHLFLGSDRFPCPKSAWNQEIFLAMDHPHVASLTDVYESEEQLYLVMVAWMVQGGVFPPIKCERWLIRFDKPWKKSWVSIDISGYICHRPGDFPSFFVCLPEGMLLWNCWPRESQCYKDLLYKSYRLIEFDLCTHLFLLRLLTTVIVIILTITIVLL